MTRSPPPKLTKTDAQADPTTGTTSKPIWREPLPDGCPPPSAAPLDEQIVLRFVPSQTVKDGDFDSHAALGGRRPDTVSVCDHRACSVFLSTKKREELEDIRKTSPRLRRMRYLAHVRINHAAGVGRVNQKAHVNLWMYAAFDPVGAVVHFEPLS
jgi:hypothetical protein